MSPYWLVRPMVLYTCGETISNYWLENAQGVYDLITWDVFKAVMRGAYMTGVTALKKANGEQITA